MPNRERGVDELRRRAAGGVELIQRVEGQELDAGDRVDLFARHALPDRFHDPVGARVAVVVRVFEQVAVLAEERVVAAPGVDADALERRVGGLVETAPDLEPQPEDVPLERAAVPDRLVGEPAHFVQGERAGVQPPEHRPSALRAEIDCEKMSTHAARLQAPGGRDPLPPRPPPHSIRSYLRNTKSVVPCIRAFRIPQRAIGCTHGRRRAAAIAGTSEQTSEHVSGDRTPSGPRIERVDISLCEHAWPSSRRRRRSPIE